MQIEKQQKEILNNFASIKHYKEINYPSIVPFFSIISKDMFICLGFVILGIYLSAISIIFFRNTTLGVLLFVISIFVFIVIYILSKVIYSFERKARGSPPKSSVLVRYFSYIFMPDVRRGI